MSTENISRNILLPVEYYVLNSFNGSIFKRIMLEVIVYKINILNKNQIAGYTNTGYVFTQ